jgi:CBS domain-containing protein
VGRVILNDNAIPVGIFTERQVLKRVANNDLAPKTSSVKDVMTSRFALSVTRLISLRFGRDDQGENPPPPSSRWSGNIDQSEDFIAMMHD